MQYSILLHTENGAHTLPFGDLFHLPAHASLDADDIHVVLEATPCHDMTLLTLTATAERERSCRFSLYGKGEETLYSFNGVCKEEHILRQSPHDYKKYVFKMDMSAMPLVAVCGEQTDIFLSDHPGHCDNYTTEHFLPESGEFYLSSGDPGGSPNFEGETFLPYLHTIGGEKAHAFRLLLKKSNATSLKAIRREAFSMVDDAFGDGCGKLYHAVCFASNYMHYRRNESGSSNYWIVPGIQYANCQYARDSFYQTWILPVEMETECYHGFRESWIPGAENQLMYLIWSYRVVKKGGEAYMPMAKMAYDSMMECLHKGNPGEFLPNSDKDGAFRNWFDICCYEFDDVDTYTQGLCVCALRAAKELGFEIGNEYEKALAVYRSLFNGEFYPMSRKKQNLTLDFSVGDLLHALLFGETLLPNEEVVKTYHHIMNSRASTPYGVKIVSAPDGEYLPMEAFGAYGFVHPGMARMDLGRYANGGSYHIYEMMFHIAAHLHGAEDAVDNMIHRLYIDLDYDGATHEYMHTLHGNGVKANQGWNAVIYAMWDALCRDGRGDPRFFEAAEEKLRALS